MSPSFFVALSQGKSHYEEKISAHGGRDAMFENPLIVGAVLGGLLGVVLFVPFLRILALAALIFVLGVIATFVLSDYVSERMAISILIAFLIVCTALFAKVLSQEKVMTNSLGPVAGPLFKGWSFGVVFLFVFGGIVFFTSSKGDPVNLSVPPAANLLLTAAPAPFSDADRAPPDDPQKEQFLPMTINEFTFDYNMIARAMDLPVVDRADAPQRRPDQPGFVASVTELSLNPWGSAMFVHPLGKGRDKVARDILRIEGIFGYDPAADWDSAQSRVNSINTWRSFAAAACAKQETNCSADDIIPVLNAGKNWQNDRIRITIQKNTPGLLVLKITPR